MKKLFIVVIILLLTFGMAEVALHFSEPGFYPNFYENREDNLSGSGRVLLGVPFIRQKELYCSEAAAAMVLQYYGFEEITQEFVNENMAINFETMVEPLNDYLKNASYAVLSVESLKNEINENDPVIVRISVNDVRHTIVVVGYDEEGLIVHDPDLGKNLLLKEEILKKYWVSANGGYIAIIID